jgi:microcystin-dependent protein
MVTTTNGTVTDLGQQPAGQAFYGNLPGPPGACSTAPRRRRPRSCRSRASATGGSQPHNNMMPTLFLNYCIALQGVFPARN